MGDPRTYFILNSTDYAPDNLIQVGQLIASPRLPYRRIAPPLRSSDAFPELQESPRNDWSYQKSKSTNGEVGVFATFFNLMSTKLSGHASEHFTQTWQAAVLQTRFIEVGEDAAYAKDLIALQSVQGWLKENRTFGKTVYMVTGVKVAIQPGEAVHDSSRGSGFDAEASGDPGTGGAAALGANAKLDREAGSLQKGRPGDFVFAYRLRKVNISWRGKVRLGDDVVGADLHGVGARNRRRGGGEGGMAEDDVIDEIFLGKSDFGITLPEEDEKMDAVDEDDGEECLVVVAREEAD